MAGESAETMTGQALSSPSTAPLSGNSPVPGLTPFQGRYLLAHLLAGLPVSKEELDQKYFG